MIDSKIALKQLREKFSRDGRAAIRRFDIVEHDLDKLEKLEEVEQGLGIDLITFVKATSQGIYIIDYKDLYLDYDSEPSTYIYNKDEKCFVEEIQDMGASWTNKYYLKDYGKTWVVTKEELYNEKI